MSNIAEETLRRAESNIDKMSDILVDNMAAELTALAELKRMIQEMQLAQLINEQ